MIFISSLLGCRSCSKTDGIPLMYSLIDGNYDKYQKKTEFEVMKTFERWVAEDNRTCEFCGSSNIEILEVEVNDYKLYDFNRLVERCESESEYLLMFNIDKSDSNISIRTGGSTNLPKAFIRDTIIKLIETSQERPDTNFLGQTNGNFFVCTSGSFDLFTNKSLVKIERFRSSGVTRKELLSAITPLAQQVGISIDEYR